MLKYILKSASVLIIMNSTSLKADELVLTETLAPSVSQLCPTDFYTLPLHPNPKFCQQFATTLPASLSYFAASDPKATRDFYLTELGEAEDEKILKGRIVLQYADGQKVVVISKDGTGSQIDILVKSTS